MERRTAAAVAVTIFCWASSPTGIRLGLLGYTPGHVALMRFIIASCVMCIVAAWAGIRAPRPGDVPRLAALGVFGVALHHVALNFGQRGISAGASSLLAQSTPLFTAVLSRFLLGERLGKTGWAGLVLGFAGVASIVLGRSPGTGVQPAGLLVVVAALSWSIYFVLQKPLLQRYSPLELTCYTVWGGTALLAGFSRGLWAEVLRAPLAATVGVAYLGAFPSAVAYLAWSYALARLPVGRTTSLLYLVPPTAIAIAWVVLGEPPGATVVAGGAVILLGIGLVQAGARLRWNVGFRRSVHHRGGLDAHRDPAP
ncbi:DMT family transporter [Sorangium sp. So ce406]|uniref:DMT family transporter n=1 Tax=Sorangium sp. So ce406 TaxID=3133311 RepID=UPI003F5C2CAA